MNEAENCRAMTAAERHLVQWMLENGSAEAQQFLPQLERAQVMSWRCPCGCASINFLIQGQAEPSGGMHPLADYEFGCERDLSGIFVYEQGGILAGLEVYAFAVDAPRMLPTPGMLRLLSNEPKIG